jgi:hypothetical protein
VQEIFFFDEGATPLPQSEVHIEGIVVKPNPDGTRVHTNITLSPFLEKPNLGISVANQDGITLVTAEVLEPISIITELTLHIRPKNPESIHTLTVDLYYEENESQDTKSIDFYPLDKSITP